MLFLKARSRRGQCRKATSRSRSRFKIHMVVQSLRKTVRAAEDPSQKTVKDFIKLSSSGSSVESSWRQMNAKHSKKKLKSNYSRVGEVRDETCRINCIAQTISRTKDEQPRSKNKGFHKGKTCLGVVKRTIWQI